MYQPTTPPSLQVSVNEGNEHTIISTVETVAIQCGNILPTSVLVHAGIKEDTKDFVKQRSK